MSASTAPVTAPTATPLPAVPQHAVGRAGLPGRALAQGRLPGAERAVFTSLVPLLSVPALLATGGAPWVVGTALVLTAVVAWLCLARHVVVGHGWVADRRLWRYRVTHAGDLRAVELVGNGHGGLLELRPHVGRPHRLREPEFASPSSRRALAALVVLSGASACPHSRRLLGLAPAPTHVVAVSSGAPVDAASTAAAA